MNFNKLAHYNAHYNDGRADARETFDAAVDLVPSFEELMSDAHKRESLKLNGESDVEGALFAWAQGYRAAAFDMQARK